MIFTFVFDMLFHLIIAPRGLEKRETQTALCCMFSLYLPIFWGEVGGVILFASGKKHLV